MKKLIVGILLSLNIFATQGLIEEAVYILGNDKSVIKLIEQNPELTMDHMDHEGFELYGPKGMKEWLKNTNISFTKLSENSHSQKSASNGYPSFKNLENFLKLMAQKYPKLTKLESIGKSVEGRDLWVLKISDNAKTDEVEPEFKYISSMHGDEITGRELTRQLIKDMLEAYGSDKEITKLINNTEIFIMPSMNPDGSKKRKRANANGIDLNRNFPKWTSNQPNTTAGRQPETVAVMNFQAKRKFSLSANFHGGAVCVNYPWDSSYERHPLDSLVQKLSLTYADQNPEMRNSSSFNRGITNGADWYVLHGGMQDWSYFWYNDLQVTVELSQQKWPSYSRIPRYYQDNKDSMLAYAKAVHQGAGFILSDKQSGTVRVVKRNEFVGHVTSDLGSFGFSDGEFYKVLEPGLYDFAITKSNGQKVVKEVVVQTDNIFNNGNFVVIE